MSQSGSELLSALRDLRQSIAAEAAKRIERWKGDTELASFTAAPPISPTIWRFATTICATCSLI